MKIRQGFVSNSSSSSFIVFGRNIDIKDITPSIIKEKEIICLGKELSDGQDIFYIENIDMLAFLKALNELGRDIEYDMEFIEVYSVGGFDEYSGELDLTNLTTKKMIKIILPVVIYLILKKDMMKIMKQITLQKNILDL